MIGFVALAIAWFILFKSYKSQDEGNDLESYVWLVVGMLFLCVLGIIFT